MVEDSVRSEQGFTLLELLLAMVLSVIVITSMSAVFKVVVDSSISIDTEVSLNQQGRVLLGIMQNDLSGLVVSNSTSEENDYDLLRFTSSTGPASAGESFLAFATTNELYASNSTSYPIDRVSYSLSESADGNFSLMRKSRRHAHLSGNWEPQEIKLSDNVSELKVEFPYGEGGLTMGSADISSAKAIKITLTLRGKDKSRSYMTTIPLNPVGMPATAGAGG